ncbi:hypothetical protein J3E69DRAFT_129735 [Trichoderma sp. SZMC 28015]
MLVRAAHVRRLSLGVLLGAGVVFGQMPNRGTWLSHGGRGQTNCDSKRCPAVGTGNATAALRTDEYKYLVRAGNTRSSQPCLNWTLRRTSRHPFSWPQQPPTGTLYCTIGNNTNNPLESKRAPIGQPSIRPRALMRLPPRDTSLTRLLPPACLPPKLLFFPTEATPQVQVPTGWRCCPAEPWPDVAGRQMKDGRIRRTSLPLHAYHWLRSHERACV